MSPDPNPAIFVVLMGAAIFVGLLFTVILGDAEEGKSDPKVTPEELELVREIRELKRRRALDKSAR